MNTQRSDDPAQNPLELSVVMPCLNEADTLETCLRKARSVMTENGIAGEIIVADNGSTDESIRIAADCGARVVNVVEKGYGNALMGGIDSAAGRYVIMGDADDSYDFLEIPKFVEKLREGYDLVQGCRLPSGGGRVLQGAMPFLHRWWGNPMFSFLARRWFKAPIHDIYCGMRGFTKAHYSRLEQQCTGMEFATEMIIKSSLYADRDSFRIAEVPITLHPDGRKSHKPHLKTFRDGWRTMRFFLMYSPRWLFLLPGGLLLLLGVIGYGMALPAVTAFGVTFDAHTLLFASMFIMCGYQAILFAILTKTFAISEKLMPEDVRLTRFFQLVDLERTLLISAIAFIIGIGLLIASIIQWSNADFGPLDYAETMRLVIPGSTLVALSFQTVFSGFFISVLGMKRK